MAKRSRLVPAAIDHGTTNSAIAVMESHGPRVIRPHGVEPIMPSVVYINKKGRTFIGHSALQAMMLNGAEEGDGHSGYKLRIGQDDRYAFRAAGKVLTAPDLGSLVLGELMRAYENETNEELRACVVTHPAKFDQAACEGTREAAQKAGLLYYPLLQEPVAAAMAYGFSNTKDRDYWMVFDLGGGTLDVSLVVVRGGHMVVPDDGHAGDNNLGGRKFDRELMDHVLDRLGRQYVLKSFNPKNPTYAVAWNKLLLAVELAKIELSNKPSARVEVPGVLCNDDNGKPVKVELVVERDAYEQMIGPDINRCVDICEALLSKNRLLPKDIGRIMLVGGPTKTPYVKRVLEQRLKVRLDDSIDPMTAVVQGAAMYAATQEIPAKILIQIYGEADAGEPYSIQVESEPQSKLPTIFVTGRAQGAGIEKGGCWVELTRKDGGWSSGRLALDPSGMFEVELRLLSRETPTLSEFTTSLHDPSGRKLTSVDEPRVWHPYPDVDLNQPNSLLVELAGNETACLIKAGTRLACSEEGKFKTAHPVHKGSQEEVLCIPVLEAVTSLLGMEDSSADCNMRVGTLLIPGTELSRDLPEGTDVDVTISVDKSRVITVTAFIPLVNNFFKGQFRKGEFGITLDEVEKRLQALSEDIAEIEQLQRRRALPAAAKALEKIRQPDQLEEIRKDLARARQGEVEAEDRAVKRTIQLKSTVSQLRKMQRSVRIQQQIEDLERVAKDQELNDLNEIKRQFEAARKREDAEALSSIERAIEDLEFTVRIRPSQDLYIDVKSIQYAVQNNRLGSENNNMACATAFNNGVDLHNRLAEKGDKNLTEQDLKELEAMHQRLMKTYLNLGTMRQDWLKTQTGTSNARKAGASLIER